MRPDKHDLTPRAPGHPRNRRLQFQKHGQLFIRTHNKASGVPRTLSDTSSTRAKADEFRTYLHARAREADKKGRFSRVRLRSLHHPGESRDAMQMPRSHKIASAE